MRASRATPGRSELLALLCGAAALASCRHTIPAVPPALEPPAGWQALQTPVAPFAALYRLECCGRRGLVATVRADGEHVALAVASPPLPGTLQVWLGPDGGAATPNGGRCRELLTPRLLPISEHEYLRLDPRELAPALSGVIPGDVRPSRTEPGWLVSHLSDGRLLWRVTGPDPRLVELDVEGADRRRLATLKLADHHGRVPGRIDLDTPGEKAQLRLVEWHRGEALSPPAWLSSPPCAGKGA